MIAFRCGSWHTLTMTPVTHDHLSALLAAAPASMPCSTFIDFLIESVWRPMQAAKWRQEQRGGSRRRRQLIVWDAIDANEQADDGRARPAVDVRNRLSEVLQADRSESWDDI